MFLEKQREEVCVIVRVFVKHANTTKPSELKDI